MQVTINSPKPVFNPVTITLIIDNEDEYKVLKKLVSHSMTVPEYIYGDTNNKDYNTLSKIMETLYQMLKKHDNSQSNLQRPYQAY